MEKLATRGVESTRQTFDAVKSLPVRQVDFAEPQGDWGTARIELYTTFVNIVEAVEPVGVYVARVRLTPTVGEARLFLILIYDAEGMESDTPEFILENLKLVGEAVDETSLPFFAELVQLVGYHEPLASDEQ